MRFGRGEGVANLEVGVEQAMLESATEHLARSGEGEGELLMIALPLSLISSMQAMMTRCEN